MCNTCGTLQALGDALPLLTTSLYSDVTKKLFLRLKDGTTQAQLEVGRRTTAPPLLMRAAG